MIPPRVRLFSSGCRLNRAETDSLLADFLHLGFSASPDEADLCVVNTCTVTSRAESKSRNLIRKISRIFPSARIILTGCYATTDPEALKKISPGALVVGNGEKDRIAETAAHDPLFRRSLSPLQETPSPSLPETRTRPFLKIQDGCNESCSYCKVRIARGPQKSLPPRLIRDKILAFAETGCGEIVLTGVNAAAYKHGNCDFTGLLRSLCALRLPLRFRLSSLEPARLDPSRLEAFANERICDHFHLSIQSADPEILTRMNRHPDPERLFRIVEGLRRLRPSCAIGADIIVGFPGETNRRFSNTLSFLRETAIPFVHVFRYSDRPGTQAAGFPDKIPTAVKDERFALVTAAGKENKKKFLSSQEGRNLIFLAEKKTLLSSNYIAARPRPVLPIPGRLIRARLSLTPRGTPEAEICDVQNMSEEFFPP